MLQLHAGNVQDVEEDANAYAEEDADADAVATLYIIFICDKFGVQVNCKHDNMNSFLIF